MAVIKPAKLGCRRELAAGVVHGGADMPEHAQRPVDEVILSIAFDRVATLGTPYVGSSVPKLLEKFPKIETQPAYEMQIELPPGKAGVGGTIGMPQFVFQAGPPETRLWLTSPDDDTRLVQVQSGYFALNWRRRGGAGERYPGYSRLRQEFSDLFETVNSAINQNGQASIMPRQAELSYINIIDTNELWANHSEMSNILDLQPPAPSPLEQFSFGYTKAVLGSSNEFVGRLHLNAQPALRIVPYQGSVINVTVTARSAALSEQDLPSALSFLDTAHDETTAAFRRLLSPSALRLWELDG